MTKPRARELGIPLEGRPGAYNAITDVAGVEVGLTTIIAGEEVRTGVTIIHPRGKANHDPVFAGCFPFNGNGEMTGSAWVEEGGFLEGPVGITNTHSVGVVRDTIIAWQVEHHAILQRWSTPVVAETADGWLNDMNGFHVHPEHVRAALDGAQGGPVPEGSVGGGTGMICYEFKGGTGSASQRLPEKFHGYQVGVLVQANFGRRYQLSIAGVPVGQHLTENALFTHGENPFRQPEPGEAGSLIVVLATDAPLLPNQLRRLARRATIGMARTGSMGGNGSGDIFLAFSTANPGAARPETGIATLQALPNDQLDMLFGAAAYATEEAILNALLAAETMSGHEGRCVPALPHDRVVDLLRAYKRLVPA
jgi:D-aminopeptidase